GADAIYLGLKDFNARERARNFSYNEFLTLLDIAKENNIKVYVTLNIVIKNIELRNLLNTLFFLSQTSVSAVIIQDWGVYYLAKKHFPKLVLHASTQMRNHNSAGAIFSKHKGFERVIMARELTMPELIDIKKKSDIELEIFAHGALCYSFSGMCLFSSYLGGMSANRGQCKQPCRRLYKSGNDKNYIFNLKDNEQITNIKKFIELGISSIKLEGRMKPAEYVYKVAKAYRHAIDKPNDLEKSIEMLENDLGRDKTSYFLGGNVKDAISDIPNTGLYIGKVNKIFPDGFSFSTTANIENGNRIRIVGKNDKNQVAIKLKDFEIQNKNTIIVKNQDIDIHKGEKIYLTDNRQIKFSSKFKTVKNISQDKFSQSKASKIISKLGSATATKKEQIFVRIDSLKWLRKIYFNDIDGLILNLQKRDWENLKTDAKFLKQNAKKLIIELPKFISESNIEFYKNLCSKLFNKGYKNFILSNLSQKIIVPENANIFTNENVYAYNDAAAEFISNQGIKNYTYPLENDIENLIKGNDRNGIVPVFFYPQLFYSRMPIELNNDENKLIDDMNENYNRTIRDGFTIITPEIPVSFLQYKKKLHDNGFRNFLIDMSFEKPSDNTLKTIIKRLKQSKQIQPSNNFNFKRELT
ncbi:MAG: peptidase U32 family protein, partial [Bacteroidota bacterium]|nr:peptidase U32 family protein [Bacteroidota bacterium]